MRGRPRRPGKTRIVRDGCGGRAYVGKRELLSRPRRSGREHRDPDGTRHAAHRRPRFRLSAPGDPGRHTGDQGRVHLRQAVRAGRHPGNALDIGIFDHRGTELGGKGFRGWSGGARTEFFIRADDATPGYIPGPVREGTWHIVLGPYTVAPQGLDYEVTITLTYGEQAEAVEPAYPPERAKGRGRAWYRGDCHLHSWYSDGRRTPRRSPRWPARRAWTSSTARTTTRTRRTRTGPTRPATTCW